MENTNTERYELINNPQKTLDIIHSSLQQQITIIKSEISYILDKEEFVNDNERKVYSFFQLILNPYLQTIYVEILSDDIRRLIHNDPSIWITDNNITSAVDLYKYLRSEHILEILEWKHTTNFNLEEVGDNLYEYDMSVTKELDLIEELWKLWLVGTEYIDITKKKKILWKVDFLFDCLEWKNWNIGFLDSQKYINLLNIIKSTFGDMINYDDTNYNIALEKRKQKFWSFVNNTLY